MQAPPCTQPLQIWGKKTLFGAGGAVPMERESTFGKHPAAASILLWCKPSLFLPAWDGGLCAWKGIPAAERAGAPRPPCCPSVRLSLPRRWARGARPDLPARAASAALITPLAPGAGALRPNYHRSFAPAQSMPLTEALERQIRAPRPGKAAAASGVGDATAQGEMWEAQGCPRLVLSIPASKRRGETPPRTCKNQPSCSPAAGQETSDSRDQTPGAHSPDQPEILGRKGLPSQKLPCFSQLPLFFNKRKDFPSTC